MTKRSKLSKSESETLAKNSKRKVTGGQGWSLVQNNNAPSAPQAIKKPEDHKLKFTLEKRAKGKSVSVIGPFFMHQSDLKSLAKKLKSSCGTGGSCADGHIELQGDFCEKAKAWLEDMGWNLA